MNEFTAVLSSIYVTTILVGSVSCTTTRPSVALAAEEPLQLDRLTLGAASHFGDLDDALGMSLRTEQLDLAAISPQTEATATMTWLPVLDVTQPIEFVHADGNAWKMTVNPIDFAYFHLTPTHIQPSFSESLSALRCVWGDGGEIQGIDFVFAPESGRILYSYALVAPGAATPQVPHSKIDSLGPTN